MNVSAIIVAGGNSSRMGGINKQFIELNGKTVVFHSIEKISKIDEVTQIVLVTKKENFEVIKENVASYNVSKPVILCEGGETRQESVLNGLSKCSDESDYILIHDGARPLVMHEDIKKVLQDAEKYKAATLGVPSKDTIKVIDETGFIVDTPDRNMLYITQTPQVFEKKTYMLGVQKAKEQNKDFTDDCQLVENIGVKVFMTRGNYSNIKITTPEDENIAKTLLNSME